MWREPLLQSGRQGIVSQAACLSSVGRWRHECPTNFWKVYLKVGGMLRNVSAEPDTATVVDLKPEPKQFCA